MEKGNWIEIELKIKNKIKEIFYNCNIENLNDCEKRKIVFEYLCNNLSYDYVLLNNIKEFNEGKKRISRNPYSELLSVINNKKGICNAISQYYKLLLEELGIMVYCVICDDGTMVNHQLNLVYDRENDCYSFDDITSVIVGRGSIEDYYDYDLEFAREINQGNIEIFDNYKWVILSEDYINYLVGREKSISLNLDELPTNITSIKQMNKFNK